MAKPLRPKRGTTAKNDAFTGLASEITIDTEKHSIRVHDGVTAGGHEILPKSKNDELYAPSNIDIGVKSVNGETGDVVVNKLALGDVVFELTESDGAILNSELMAKGHAIITPPDNSAEGGELVLMPPVGYGEDDAIRIDHSLFGVFRVFLASIDEGLRVDFGEKTVEAFGKEIERVHSVGSNYIRLSGGLQACWGGLALDDKEKTEVTLPVAYSGTDYVVVVSCTQVGFGAASTLSADPVSENVIKINQSNEVSATMGVCYLCVGNWR